MDDAATTTVLTDADLDGLAQALRQAEATRRPVPTPSDALTLGVDDAYEVQRRNTARRVAAGESIVGRKVGLTSLAMQQQLGVDQPDFGVLFASMLLPSGAVLAADELVAPRVEAELAFRLGADLFGDPDEQTVADAVCEVLLALEVIDSRVADWRITIADTVADNASSARAVLGAPRLADPALLASLPDLLVTLSVDGQQAAAGPGRAVLGHPLRAVQWLVRALDRFGEGLRAGDVVLAGAVHASLPLAPGQSLTATCEGFAAVTLEVAP